MDCPLDSPFWPVSLRYIYICYSALGPVLVHSYILHAALRSPAAHTGLPHCAAPLAAARTTHVSTTHVSTTHVSTTYVSTTHVSTTHVWVQCALEPTRGVLHVFAGRWPISRIEAGGCSDPNSTSLLAWLRTRRSPPPCRSWGGL